MAPDVQPIKIGTAPFPISQKQAAEEAGFSSRQVKEAVRLANIPKAKFERMVESVGQHANWGMRRSH